MASVGIVDAKSLWDHMMRPGVTSVADKTIALDVLQCRELTSDLPLKLKWAPSPYQLADVTTIDTSEAADAYRAATRTRNYVVGNEEEYLAECATGALCCAGRSDSCIHHAQAKGVGCK